MKDKLQEKWERSLRNLSINFRLDNASIFGKGLLLTLVPVIVQLISVALYWQTYNQFLKSRDWFSHSQDVLAKVEEFVSASNAAYYNSLLAMFLSSRSVNEEKRHFVETGKLTLLDLFNLVRDNNQQQQRLFEIERAHKQFTAIFLQLEAAADFPEGEEQTERLLPSRAQLIRSLFRDSTAAKNRLDEKVSLFRDKELELLDIRTQSRDSLLVQVTWISFGVYILMVTVSCFLYLMFRQSIAERLKVVLDNLSRIELSTSLAPRLKGTDEIAQLDTAIHSLSDSLTARATENEMFLYSVSHDLRSPLVNISGFADEIRFSLNALRENLITHSAALPELKKSVELIDTDFNRLFGFMKAGVGRLSSIIDGLLRLSRLGRVQFRNDPVELDAVVSKVILSLETSIKKANAEMTIEKLPLVYGDEGALEQIFANLLSNAVTYLDPKRPGKITVGVDTSVTEDNFATIFVKDNGVGLSEAAQKKIFIAFQRFNPEIASGEGIGLALVRRAVSKLAGKIHCESVLGEGTTFFLSFPRVYGPRLEVVVSPVGV